ncbi:prospero homeobox 3 isoform X2 [Salminus brasiliensis]|uniref:prospero homeobox 3 isoform X2 n=1 Tax=Salminus brasiliensis TaxID=930266 RepID=UPI003B834278
MMDSPSDLFQQQQQQQSHAAFDLYTRSPLESTSTGSTYPASSPAPYPIVSPLLHPNSASQRWGGYRQRQCLFSELPVREEAREEDVEVLGRRAAEEASQVPLPRLVERRRASVPESCDWSQDIVRVKRLRVDNVLRRDGDLGREEHRGRRRIASHGPQEEKSGGEEEEGRRKENREGRRRQRRELKLQLEETRGKLMELQRKVWRAYGEQRLEEEKERAGPDEDGAIDEVAEMFSEGEVDDCPASGLSPGMFSSGKKHEKHESRQNGNSEDFPEEPTDMDMELDGGGVWLGCSLVEGEWENTSGNDKEKFAQALKQELANVVARVIDRVVRLYAESDHSPTPASVLAQETPASRVFGPNPGRKPRLGFRPNVLLAGGTHGSEQAEALPLVARKLQDKRNPLSQGKHKHPVIPPQNPSLPFLPQPPLPALLPPRNKEPFLPSCPPNPPPFPLPLLHYTMQHLFTRSLSSLPLHKDSLSSEPFMEFRSHNPSFPPLPPLLAQLNPSLADRGRDEGLRVGGIGGMDGGDEGLSPCHLKKAKLMFFYTRYPSSNTLKTYFPDVKFNRCVTSQLIKWFSNFREFFYIQMERFARQAAREGLPASRDRALRLGRNSELFRILNMHYNKSNDYQVPDRFVEVSELALREFFAAIQGGRDTDPCWKKSIYKIICKLDSPVPDSFRLPGCPMDTHRMV